jgi:starch phosphorylase
MCAAIKSKKTAPAAAKSVAETPDTATIDSVNAKFKQSILRHLTYTLARDMGTAGPRDWWIATAMAARDTILARLIVTQGVHNDQNVRRLYYFSLEYLMGRLLENNLYNTGLIDAARTASQ